MAKVLVVEDDNNLREIYETSLKAEGYDTSSAADGMEALEIAGRDKPDLIISDVMMPRLSGFEMLEKMRQDQNLKDIPVIMMTALSMAEDKDTAKRLGVVHYLVKSQVTLEDFVNVAKKFVPVDGSAGAPSTTPAPEPAPETPAPEPASTPAPTAAEPPAQTTSDETNAVEAQIESFVASQQTDTPLPNNQTPEPTSTPAPSPSEPVAADAQDTDSTGKKVIQPIVDPNKKDINELAKAEEVKAQSNTPVSNPPAGNSVDPNSIAL